MPRPSWDEYFMSLAHLAATRSTCLRRHVGAVIVKDRMVLSTGYNDTPRGVPNCGEGGCARCASEAASGTALDTCLCLHAEQNAIVQAAYHGVSIAGGTIYCTHQPCLTCAKMIVNAGLVRIVYDEPYPDPVAERLLTDASIAFSRFAPVPADSPPATMSSKAAAAGS
ncbi:MAG TPA: cytidine/deoxycytidylate deaminase family protein [bacterium]|nr:cytidine/deoxycytidylate deaminase family protein [bacterium]